MKMVVGLLHAFAVKLLFFFQNIRRECRGDIGGLK